MKKKDQQQVMPIVPPTPWERRSEHLREPISKLWTEKRNVSFVARRMGMAWPTARKYLKGFGMLP